MTHQPLQEEILEGEHEEGVEEGFVPPLKMKVICGYLYFIQGIIISLPGTMTIVYSNLPPYWILSLFSAATLSFSFKFLEGTASSTQLPSLRSSQMWVMASARPGSSSARSAPVS